jgi:hypothetical protein
MIFVFEKARTDRLDCTELQKDLETDQYVELSIQLKSHVPKHRLSSHQMPSDWWQRSTTSYAASQPTCHRRRNERLVDPSQVISNQQMVRVFVAFEE